MIHTAVIPAAGRGVRLDRPGTPKPLVDVGGCPLAVRLVRQLELFGVKNVFIVTGYENEKTERALRKYDFEAQVSFIYNKDWSQGLSRSVLAAKPFVNAPFILAMADHVFDDETIAAAVAVTECVESATAVVDTRLDEVFALSSAVKVAVADNRVSAIGRNLEKYNAVDTGLFVFSPDFFDILEKSIKPEQENDLASALEFLILQKKLNSIQAQGRVFDDVDTPAALVHAELRFRNRTRTSRAPKPEFMSSSKLFQTYPYQIDYKKETKMVVGRGFLNDPSSINLIPDDAASSPIFLFTDETVNELYGKKLADTLQRMNYDIHRLVLPDGEESKSLTNYSYLVERVLSQGVDERSVFISLGGGVVCNVCGFVASTIYRGLDLVHLPTTVMAQCDAAISHKQAINGYQGKNLVGSYYSPRLVAVDVETLNTLPDRLISDGLSEVIKHALGQDVDYIEFLQKYNGDIRDLDFLEEVITRNVRLKCDLVKNDPKEHREGMILQYGHTVGHAVERLSGYRLYHGESVGIGMAVAARVARLLGACDDSLVSLHDSLISKFKLPTKIPAGIRPEDILASVRYSKRFLTEGTRMALLSEPGKLWCVDDEYAIPVSDQVITEAVIQCMEENHNV